MNKNLKVLSILGVLLIGLLGLTAFASADSDLYDITQVKVNDITMTSDTVSDVQLQDATSVDVYLEGTGNSSTCPSGDVNDCAVDNVQVKVWIGGYEYGDIEATSSEFTVEPGVSYKKTLTLDIPKDLNVKDNNDYTLYVEVYDSKDSERQSYDLYAERPEHNLNIIDTLYDATVNAGDRTPVEVRVENLGQTKEEDIKVEATLGDLTTGADYINELAAKEIDNADEESSDSGKIVLTIPKDAVTGYYDLNIKVTYNRGYDTATATYRVWVNGVDAPASDSSSGSSSGSSNGKTTISLSTTSLDGKEGDPTSFDLTFTNTGTESQTYMVTVNGEDQWASSEVSPSSIIVGPGESQQVAVTVTPKDGSAGTQDFSLQILNADGSLVKDVSMSMSVDSNSSFFGNTSSALKVGFIIVIVLIIIIGLIVAFRKLKDDDDEDPLEPKDGKTYY